MTRPSARLKAAALILDFLNHVGEARIERVVRYMDTPPLRVAPGTTRNVLILLVRAGKIERSGYGKYRRINE